MQGIDDELGQEEMQEDVAREKVVDFSASKKKRKAFHIWEVGGNEYRLKLTASNICILEEKYKRNLLDLVSMGNIPPLNIMLTIFQAAMLPWHHKITYKTVQGIYEKYVEEGGSQTDLVSKVLMPTLSVSGFFSLEQAESMEEKLQEESLL